MSEPLFKCEYCDTEYVREHAYYNHKCEPKRRHELMQTKVGWTAYEAYSEWMRQNKRMVPSRDTFMSSKLFKPFVTFAEFVRDSNLKQWKGFISIMVDRDIAPNLWTHEKAYSLFIEHFDNYVPVMQQVDSTVNWIMKLSDGLDVETGEIFNHIEPKMILDLIKLRHITPWVLLNSNTFLKTVQMRFSVEQKQTFNNIVRLPYWKLRFTRNPDVVTNIKKIVNALGLR